MKLFRKIRQNLLKDGKTVRYLKYAFGEIILVVIGILIALSINNWNQNRLLQNEEIKYYENIKRQLVGDTYVINNNINFNNHYYEQYQYALKLLENEDRNKLDTLGIIAINLLEYSDFHQETNVYNTLVNSGEIKLLNNQEILDGLQRLEEIYIYINKIEATHFDIIKIIYSDVNKTVRLNPVRIENVDRFFNFEFQNHFIISSDVMREKDEVYNRALDEINFILELIDKELSIND